MALNIYQICANNGILHIYIYIYIYIYILRLDAVVSPVFGLCFGISAIFVMFTASNCDGFWESLELLCTRISLSLQISVVC
jgi:hypothetical protein